MDFLNMDIDFHINDDFYLNIKKEEMYGDFPPSQ